MILVYGLKADETQNENKKAQIQKRHKTELFFHGTRRELIESQVFLENLIIINSLKLSDNCIYHLL
jgi:hypothetical protein